MKMIPGYHQIPLLGRKPKTELPFAVARRRARKKIDVGAIREYLGGRDRASRLLELIEATGTDADGIVRLGRALSVLARRGYLIQTPVYYAADTTQMDKYEGCFHVYSLPGEPVNWPYSLDPTVLPPQERNK